MKNYRKFYKKSQGNILVIVLVILIVITAAIVVWNFVYPMIKQKGGEADTSLFNINLNIKEVSLSEIGASKIVVQRNSGAGEISSLKFIFYDKDGQSYSISQEKDLPQELETKTYFFSPLPNFKTLKTVSVVPVINNKFGIESKSDNILVLNSPLGLVSWWRFNDHKDSVGNNHGLNSIDIHNGNIILDGNNYMVVGNDSSLDMDKEFAISSWIKADSYVGKIISKGANYNLLINPETQKINFVYGSDEYIESYNPINLNEWQQVVVSIDWKGVWKIYINGNQEFIGTKTITPVLNPENVLIGQGFDGEIDDIMLFNRSLSVENIKFLYNNQRS